MKKTSLAIALLLCGMANAMPATAASTAPSATLTPPDNLGDAKAAFQEFVDDHRTHNPRTLDLFLPDCAVTYTYVAGKQTKDVHIPMIKYAAMIDAAYKAKKGTHDQFENPKFTVDGIKVIVTATVLAGDSHREDPLTMVYERDMTGQMSIKVMHVTVPVEKLP
jgi:hypothetical protein